MIHGDGGGANAAATHPSPVIERADGGHCAICPITGSAYVAYRAYAENAGLFSSQWSPRMLRAKVMSRAAR